MGIQKVDLSEELTTAQMSMRLIQQAFKYGIDCDIIHGGIISGGEEQGLNELSAAQNYKIATRLIRPDGRVFRYSIGGNIMTNILQGVKFWHRLDDTGVGTSDGYANVVRAQVVGDSVVQLDGSSGVTKNSLAGGYIVVHTHSDKSHQFRGVVSNTAADSDGYIVVTVDAPLTIALTTSHDAECWLNPYSDIRWDDPGTIFKSVAGVLVTPVTTAGYHMWLQTWGMTFMNMYGTSGSASVTGERQLVFDGAGNVGPPTDSRNGTADEDFQHAGFIVDRTAGGTGFGLMMLQISP